MRMLSESLEMHCSELILGIILFLPRDREICILIEMAHMLQRCCRAIGHVAAIVERGHCIIAALGFVIHFVNMVSANILAK